MVGLVRLMFCVNMAIRKSMLILMYCAKLYVFCQTGIKIYFNTKYKYNIFQFGQMSHLFGNYCRLCHILNRITYLLR